MDCPRCGYALEPLDSKCRRCGSPVGPAQGVPPPGAAPPPLAGAPQWQPPPQVPPPLPPPLPPPGAAPMPPDTGFVPPPGAGYVPPGAQGFARPCPGCGAQVPAHLARCPYCGRPVQAPGAVRYGRAATEYDWNRPHPCAIAAYVLAGLSFLCAPICFGPIGLVLAVVAVAQGDKKHGVVALCACVVIPVISAIVGAILMSAVGGMKLPFGP